MNSKTIHLCPLRNYPSLETFLLEEFCLSKAFLKKHLKTKTLHEEVLARKAICLSLDIINHGLINPSYRGESIEEIYEDENFLVFDKPYGIHCHPLNYSDDHSVLSFMRQSGRGNLLEINKNSYERGLLYRLDAVTSGVLVYVKSEELYKHLREKFHEVVSEKIYLAYVMGNFEHEGGVKLYFSSWGIKGHRVRADLNYSKGSQEGELRVKRVFFDEEKKISLLQITLGTGLRHQIRASLNFLKFPIIGDTLYLGPAFYRVLLHADSYRLRLPSGQNLFFKSKQIFSCVGL